MAIDFSTLRRPINPQVVDPSTGRMRDEWQLYFDQLTTRLNGAVGELGTDPAPPDAEYLTGAASSGLSAERVVTNTTSITWDLATPGQAKAKRAALTGDVTASADSNTTTIANGAVTVAKVDASVSGNRWGIVPVVGQSDGGMEIGDFIDFHNSDGDTSDFSMRLDSFSLTNSMTHTAAGQTPRALAGIPTNALASGQIPVWRNSAQIFDALAQGNSGEFLKSQGAGTVPVFTPIKQGQTVIASGSFPAANNLDITGIPSDIASLSLFIANVSSNTNTRKLRLFFSTNNGASYDTTLGNYPIWSIANSTLAWTQIATVSAINCPVMTAAQSANMIININNSPAAAFPQVISQITSTVGADGNVLGISQWFNGPMNALRITWDSTGNFDGGTYALVAYS